MLLFQIPVYIKVRRHDDGSPGYTLDGANYQIKPFDIAVTRLHRLRILT